MVDTTMINSQTPQNETGQPKKKLYRQLKKRKLYSQSYKDFKNQFNDEESIYRLHGALKDKGLLSLDPDSFHDQYFPNVIKSNASRSSKSYKFPVVSESDLFGDNNIKEVSESDLFGSSKNPPQNAQTGSEISPLSGERRGGNSKPFPVKRDNRQDAGNSDYRTYRYTDDDDKYIDKRDVIRNMLIN